MNILRQLKTKYNINNELATLLINYGIIRKVSKGDFLYYQDEQADFIIIPLDGVLNFSPQRENGSYMQYNIITPGILLNDVQFLTGGEMQADIRATSDAIVLKLLFSDANLILQQSSSFSIMLSTSLAKKQRATMALFNLRGEKNHRLKVQKALRTINELTDNKIIPFNILTLASLLNISRNSVGREIKHFIKSGELVKTHSGYQFLDHTVN